MVSIIKPLSLSHPAWVCGLKQRTFTAIKIQTASHPAWVCGLKLIFEEQTLSLSGHTLRGCVDWNIIIAVKWFVTVVTPCVGVWIETWISSGTGSSPASHTLRGCVDWNVFFVQYVVKRQWVTPCVGVWIETSVIPSITVDWVVTPCVGVWIETHYIGGWSSVINVTPCVGVWIETAKRHQ